MLEADELCTMGVELELELATSGMELELGVPGVGLELGTPGVEL